MTKRFGAAASLLVVSGSCGRESPGTPPAASQDDLAHCLVAAMLVHDLSILEAEWTQVQDIGEDAHPGVIESHQAFTADGKWSCQYTTRTQSADGSERVQKDHVVFAGQELHGCSLTGRGCTIRPWGGQSQSYMSIEVFLGRFVAGNGYKRLGEALLAATDLHMGPPSARGLPVVVATGPAGQLAAEFEVEIDPEHGFAARTIVVRDLLIRLPYARFEVMEFVENDGCWLPARGVATSRKFSPTPEEWKRFSDALAAESKDIPAATPEDPYPTAIRVAHARALRTAFDADEAPSHPLVPPQRLEWKYLSVNKPLPDALFTFTFPQEFRAYDGLRDRVKPAGSETWTPQSPRSRQPE